MLVTDVSFLQEACEDTNILDAQNIIYRLINILEESKFAVGLAANQIGIKKKVCVVKTNSGIIGLVNPVVVDCLDRRLFLNEQCLSFPGGSVVTERFNEILVKDLLNPNGIVFYGVESVIAQHEIDHLFGKTMFDYEVKIPTRNERCWCGSGRKFKKCCVGKTIY